MQESVLQINGLTRTYGARTVVNDVSFDVRPGEMFGFLGPNGSGKTTTVRMCLGIVRPNSGTVNLLGSPPDWRTLKGVGYLPEAPGLPPLEGPRAGRDPLPWPPQRADLH